MTNESYFEMAKRHQQELEAFPMAFAFSNQQLDEALKKLGATEEECCSYYNIGDIMKKSDVPLFKSMMNRQYEELQNAMKDEQFAEEAFRYEMDNHEYAINWSGDDDVLSELGLNRQSLRELGLEDAYRRARNGHMRYMEALGII